jgi:phytoene synthase
LSANSSGQLNMAYTVCRGVARAQARNFYWAFLALPREKRNALCAVYAFMRHADDLSDEPGIAPEVRRQKLIDWSEKVHATCEGKKTDDPILMALADTAARFKVPTELFEQLIYGTSLDVPKIESEMKSNGPQILYHSFDDLYRYCYYVASVVGLVCIHIFGFEDEKAKQLAESTGIAFQLTNIIRDVKEDALIGRIYLPAEDLQKFERTPSELARLNEYDPQKAAKTPSAAKIFDPAAWIPLLSFEAERAKEFYKSAQELMPLIHEDSRPCLWALVEIYRRVLERIEEKNYDVFGEKIRLSSFEKATVLMRGLMKVIF